MRHRHPRPTPLTLLALGTAATLLLLSLACGRKGDPRPRSELAPSLNPPPASAVAAPGR